MGRCGGSGQGAEATGEVLVKGKVRTQWQVTLKLRGRGETHLCLRATPLCGSRGAWSWPVPVSVVRFSSLRGEGQASGSVHTCKDGQRGRMDSVAPGLPGRLPPRPQASAAPEPEGLAELGNCSRCVLGLVACP